MSLRACHRNLAEHVGAVYQINFWFSSKSPQFLHPKMVSQANRTPLLKLVKKFIDSDDPVTVARLLDLVST